LALFALLALLGTLLLGLTLHGMKLDNAKDVAAQNRGTVHRLAGIATGVVVLLVNSIVITYFVGTSRWCKEVVETYQLTPQHVILANRIKRRTFPIAVTSMLVAVGIVALGGAADPGAIMPPPEKSLHLALLAGVTWAQIHLIGALLGICLIGWSFLYEWNSIAANHGMIDDVLADVRRIRAERGLD
jgi:hypothetical protein